jgi:hypothetical protein
VIGGGEGSWVGAAGAIRSHALLPRGDKERTLPPQTGKPDGIALSQGLRGMLGLVVRHDLGEERRLLLPPAAHGHPEGRSGDAAVGVADLGWSVRLPAKLTAASVMVCPSCCLPGGCPVLGPRGRWTPWHGGRAPGQAVEPTKPAMRSGCRGGSAREPGWLADPLAAGDRACQHRPASSLHPRHGGRTRLPPRGPLAGPSQAGWSVCSRIQPR